ncbi:MAG: hypothetical protein U5L06_08785 [Rhodovibrio sp.]|nr:hypothetical protein [Rhodovibrio sp.]
MKVEEMLSGKKSERFVNNNKEFRNASWAVPESVLSEIEVLLSRIKPVDLVRRHLWLFSEWLPDIGDRNDDLKRKQEYVFEARRLAVLKFSTDSGVDAHCALAGGVSLRGCARNRLFHVFQVQVRYWNYWRRL